MKFQTRTTLIAGAIAALLAGPTWAGNYTPQVGAQTPASTNTGSGQPEVDQLNAAQQLSESPQMGTAAYGGALITPSIDNNSLYTRSANDLDGVEVVDSTGDKVGQVKHIVLAPDRKSAHAIISVGVNLGMGTRYIMVSLDELKPMNKLQMSATKADIAARMAAMTNTDNYVEMKGDTPLSGQIVEFSAFEAGKDANQPGATSATPKGEAVKPATAQEKPQQPK